MSKNTELRQLITDLLARIDNTCALERIYALVNHLFVRL